MSNKLQKYINFLPSKFPTRTDSVLAALLKAWAGQDDEIMQQLKNAKAQLFVRTAEGKYLDQLASGFGIDRPAELGLLDSDFQELIPNLSFKYKQVTKSFYDTMDVFWGVSFSRANVTSTLSAPFNINPGDYFILDVDGKGQKKITVKAEEVAVSGQATAEEIVNILKNFEGITAEVSIDAITGNKHINIRTNTPGARGSLEILPSSFTTIGITPRKYLITDLSQRTVVYQVNPGEVIIELPAVVPTLRRTLRGSHHFHASSAIEPVIPPATIPWQGSFIFSTKTQPFVVTRIKTTLSETILKGAVTNKITVADASEFPASGGKLIINYGQENQEEFVPFITAPNDNTLLIDPGYSFKKQHNPGEEINLLLEGQNSPYIPRTDGSDYPTYLTSPASARSVVQEILKTLTAAGISVIFIVLLPSYKYLYNNPYDI